MKDHEYKWLLDEIKDTRKQIEKLNDIVIRMDARQQQQWEVLWAILKDVNRK